MKLFLLMVPIFLLYTQSMAASKYELFKENTKFGIKQDNGKVLYAPVHDLVSVAHTGTFPVVLKTPAGGALVLALDSKREIVESQYEMIETSKFGGSHQFCYLVKKDNKFGYIGNSGEILLPIEYDEIRREQLRTVLVKDKKFGLLQIGGESLKVLLPAEYDYLQKSHITPIVVGKNGKFGMVDDRGRILVPLVYDNIEDGYDFPRRVKSQNLFGMIATPKLNGVHTALIPPEYEEISNSVNPKDFLFKVKKNGKWGFIDFKNKVVLPLEYTSVDGFFAGVASVTKNGQPDYLDLTGHSVGYFAQKKLEYDTTKAIQSAGFRASDEVPINLKVPSKSQQGLQLVVVPKMVPYEVTEIVGDQNIVKFMGIFLQNFGDSDIFAPAQDGQFYLIQEAMAQDGTWKKIEKWNPSDCGNSYFPFGIAKNKQRLTVGRRYQGSFNTKLRFALRLEKTEIFSNEFEGSIAPELLKAP